MEANSRDNTSRNISAKELDPWAIRCRSIYLINNNNVDRFASIIQVDQALTLKMTNKGANIMGVHETYPRDFRIRAKGSIGSVDLETDPTASIAASNDISAHDYRIGFYQNRHRPNIHATTATVLREYLMTFNDLLNTLMTLPQEPAPSAAIFKEAVEAHPDLVGETAQSLLTTLQTAQSDPDGRARVETLSRMLHRTGHEDPVAVFTDENNRMLIENAARLRETRLAKARSLFMQERREPTASNAIAVSGEILPSLMEIEDHLRALTAAEIPRPFGRNLLDPSTPTNPVPTYLFRGESGDYSSTVTSLDRLVMSERGLQDLLRISGSITAALVRTFGLTHNEALGYLQHYGFPTPFLDFTADPTVAASFASNRRIGEVGSIAVLATGGLETGLVDLRDHPTANRPRLQSAFALYAPSHTDLKAASVRQALGLKWFRFRFTTLDAARYVPNFALLDARSDEFAGLIWLFIQDCAKFDDTVAKLLSERLDVARVLCLTRRDGTMRLLPDDMSNLGEPYNDSAFRRSAYERWSEAVPAADSVVFPSELECFLRTPCFGDLEPGTIIRLLGTRQFTAGEQAGEE
ncbi:MAG TPA: FRG domain-containing protein [Rhizomicrobium sp.]